MHTSAGLISGAHAILTYARDTESGAARQLHTSGSDTSKPYTYFAIAILHPTSYPPTVATSSLLLHPGRQKRHSLLHESSTIEIEFGSAAQPPAACVG